MVKMHTGLSPMS